MPWVWIALGAVVVAGGCLAGGPASAALSDVFEFQRGLRYARGRFVGLVQPGRYWIVARNTTIDIVDVRPGYITAPGQELLSSDGVALKLSLVAKIELLKPDVATLQVQNYQQAIYVIMQLAAREIVGAATVEDLLQGRARLGEQLQERCAGQVEEIGVKLHSVEVRDLMLPGDLKRIFAQVVEARQQGMAALERARGETAALHNLGNAARLVEGSPALLQLRVLEQLAASPAAHWSLERREVCPRCLHSRRREGVALRGPRRLHKSRP